MRTKEKLRRIIPAVIAMSGLLCAGAVAHAGTIVNVTFPGRVPRAASTSGRDMAPGGGMNSTDILSFCLEMTEGMWGQHSNNVLNPPAGLATSQAAGAFQPAAWKFEPDGKTPYGTPDSVNIGKEDVEATATAAGGATVFNTAGNWSNSRSLNPSPGELANLVASSRANSHDHVSHVSHVNQNATPEASSNLIWLIFAAIGVYPIMRRRSSAA